MTSLLRRGPGALVAAVAVLLAPLGGARAQPSRGTPPEEAGEGPAGSGGPSSPGRDEQEGATKGGEDAAAPGPSARDEKDEGPGEVLLVTGTRFQGRTAMQSPVPIDSFKVEALEQQGNGDMTEILKNVLPSFAATSYTGDGSAFIRSTSLRGLPPDETLVLVNFKHRHRAALIAIQGAAMNQGAQAVDIGMIPTIALRNVEVLRDGAAAQYGSDAIAGVVNFILKDNAHGAELQARAGQWYGGEQEYQVAANVGLPLFAQGFLSLSGEYTDFEQLSRGGQHAKAQDLQDMGVANVPDPAQIWGRPEGRGVRLCWNGGLTLSERYAKPYFFGNFARTYGNYGFFYREPNKPNVSSPLPLDPMDPMQGNFSWSDPTQWPTGFTPRFEGRIIDVSQIAGVKGELALGISYDLSGTFGLNRINYTLKESINPSWGPESPTVFEPGDLQQTDVNFNADFSRPMTRNLNLAWGAEWRSETFTMYLGEEASWKAGRWSGVSRFIDPATINPMNPMGTPYLEPLVGANGYQGTSPEMRGSWTRTNWAVYLDSEWNVNQDLLVQGAGRFEIFSTFGPTLNGKVASRYALTDSFAVRGAASTGFRAPTPGQSNLTNVATIFVPGTGEQQLTGTVRPTDPIAVAYGGTPLDAEKSINLSLGVATQPAPALRLTADAYRIAVSGRIVMATEIDVPDNPTYSKIQFYTNGLDTVTTGVDVVLVYDVEWDTLGWDTLGDATISVAYNFNYTDVVRQSSLAVNERHVANIERGLPRHFVTATMTQGLGDWSLMLRSNYFGSHQDEDPRYSVGPEVLVDTQLTRRIGDRYSVMLGANNLFDNFPDTVPTRAEQGLPWPRRSPIGYHGGMVYLRAVARY